MTVAPLTMSVEDAAELLGISRWLYYDEFRKGHLPGLRIGNRIVVPRHQIGVLLGVALHGAAPADEPGVPQQNGGA